MKRLHNQIHKLESDISAENAYIRHQKQLLEEDKITSIIMLVAVAGGFFGGILLARNPYLFKKASALFLKALALQRMYHHWFR